MPDFSQWQREWGFHAHQGQGVLKQMEKGHILQPLEESHGKKKVRGLPDGVTEAVTHLFSDFRTLFPLFFLLFKNSDKIRIT